jgi:hypothetical protein
MSKLWHYRRDGHSVGQVSTGELRRLAASGELRPTDFIWREGMPDWVPAADAKNLFPKPNASVSPLSPPPIQGGTQGNT